MRNILVISLIFLCTIVFAQDEPKTSIKGGATALIFEFDGLDNLSADSYEGGLGAKLFISRNLALRFVLNFDRLSETDPANPQGILRGKNGEYRRTEFGLGAGLEYHFITKARVSPYIGGGFGFMYGSSENKPAVTYFQGANATRTVTETTGIYQFSIMGVSGVELFIIKEVSLSAEYIFDIGFYGDGNTKYTEVAISGTPVVNDSYTLKGDNGWYIGTYARGRLVLSIYF